MPAETRRVAEWQSSCRINADPGALGRRLRLNGYEFTIVGVAPESFTGMDQYFQPALYIPVHTASRGSPSGTSVFSPSLPPSR